MLIFIENYENCILSYASWILSLLGAEFNQTACNSPLIMLNNVPNSSTVYLLYRSPVCQILFKFGKSVFVNKFQFDLVVLLKFHSICIQFYLSVSDSVLLFSFNNVSWFPGFLLSHNVQKKWIVVLGRIVFEC